MVVAARLPVPGPAVGWAVDEISRRPGDFALAGAVCTVELDGSGRCSRAGVALFGVASTPVRSRGAEEVLMGEQVDEAVLDAAAAACLDGVDVLGDEVHASAAYRRTAGRALVRQDARRGGPVGRRGDGVTRAARGREPPRQRPPRGGPRRAADHAGRVPARGAGPDRHARGLRAGGVRRLHGRPRRRRRPQLPGVRRPGRGLRGADRRGARPGRRPAPAAAGVLGRPGAPVRVLHARLPHDGAGGAAGTDRLGPRGAAGAAGRQPVPLHRLPDRSSTPSSQRAEQRCGASGGEAATGRRTRRRARRLRGPAGPAQRGPDAAGRAAGASSTT